MSTPTQSSISVIIPCYRCAETIERTFTSVLNQTLIPLEVILIDDFSDDATIELLRKIRNKHPDFVKLIELQSNGGVSVARNQGVQIASGKYIAFLDSDDLWHKEKLEIQYSQMVANNAVIAAHLCELISTNFDNKIFNNLTFKWIGINFMLLSNKAITSTVMLKKDCLVKFDESLKRGEDWKCWLEAMVQSRAKIFFMQIPLSAGLKPRVGYAGLSQDLVAFHNDVLLVIRYLKDDKTINLFQYSIAMFAEQLKFPIRVIKVGFLRKFIW